MTQSTVPYDPIRILDGRTKRLGEGYAYKLQGVSQYGLDVVLPDTLEVDEKRMSVVIPFADGKRRDGVGDLLEVGGIRTERHRKNPIVLYDHAKSVSLPIGKAEDPDTGQYTVEINPETRVARGTAFFYQGKSPLDDAGHDKSFEHSVFCEQLFDLIAKRFVRGGSIGYQVVKALNLQPDYEMGTPQGLHLLATNMLEFSAVVLPANGDTVLKVLSMPTICGKKKSPYLVKSFAAYAPEQTKMVVGFNMKSLRKKYRKSVPVPHGDHSKTDVPPAKWKPGVGVEKGIRTPKSRAGYSGPLEHDISVGDRVTVRNIIPLKRATIDSPFGTFAYAGDRLRVIALRPGDVMSIIVENDKGQQQATTPSSLRKSMQAETKSLDIRKKYRKAKGLCRRLKRSSPGASVVHIHAKDISEAEKLATQKGLKFSRIGHSNGREKVKLMGDDNAIDEVAKAYGQLVGVKSMDGSKALSELLRTKADNETDLRNDCKRSSVKVYGHQYSGNYPNTWFEFKLEGDPRVVEVLKNKYHGKSLKSETKAMDQTEDVADTTATDTDAAPEEKSVEPWGAQVLRRLHEDHSLLMKDYDEMMGPLEHEHVKGHLEEHLGNMDKFLSKTEQLFSKHYKELPPLTGADQEGDAEEVTEEDKDIDDPDATPADSSPDEEVSGEDAVEGMEKETKELDSDEQKALRVKYRKKSVCPECGKADCSCKKSLKKKDMTQEEASEVEGELEQVQEDVAEQAQDTEKSLPEQHKPVVGEASGFLKELSETPDLSDEYRMKSYHYAKTLDGISQVEDMAHEHKSKPGSPEWEQEEMAEPQHKAWHKHCKGASEFLHRMSQEKAFGDSHRQEALTHHKALDPLVNGGDQEDVPEVGDMGEKSLRDQVIAQTNQIAELTRTLSLIGV